MNHATTTPPHDEGTTMLRGFTTITYYVDDVPAAVDWYTEVLAIEPYFANPSREAPAYVEFRIGDSQDELGLIDSRYRPATHAGTPAAGAVMHWHVDDVAEAHARLLSLGATSLEPPTPRGDQGWVTASVIDPFGNIIGLMYSPHYLEQLAR
jgi:predicted enzyme related to lactoylglutathione lyase